jgi:hypothetical protein
MLIGIDSKAAAFGINSSTPRGPRLTAVSAAAFTFEAMTSFLLSQWLGRSPRMPISDGHAAQSVWIVGMRCDNLFAVVSFG